MSLPFWHDLPEITDEPPLTPAELRAAAIRQSYSVDAALHDDEDAAYDEYVGALLARHRAADDLIEIDPQACDEWIASRDADYDVEVSL